MKLRQIFLFEVGYQVRRAPPWLCFLLLGVVAFLLTRDNSLDEALREDFFLNSPFSIAKSAVLCSLLWILAGVSVAGEAAGRDASTRIAPLVYTTPISKVEYLGGRFLAAMFINALVLLAAPIGICVAINTLDPAVANLGPARLDGYLTAYLYVLLPNAFLATALQFWVAQASGRPMAAFLGSLLIFVMAYVVTVGGIGIALGRPDIARLVDPLGIVFIVMDFSNNWTALEKSTRAIPLEGGVLLNRVLWVFVATVFLAACYKRFSFRHRFATKSRRRRRDGQRAGPAAAEASSGEGFIDMAQLVLLAPPTAGALRKTFAIASMSFRSLATSWTGLAFLILVPALCVPVLIDQMSVNGVPVAATTVRVLGELTSPLAAEVSRWVIIPLFIMLFAARLVWRERDARVNLIQDAMPGSEWIPVLGKFLGLSLFLVVFYLLLGCVGMLTQHLLGYDSIQAALYAEVLLGLTLPEYLLFAMLVFALYAAINQRYIAHLAALLAYGTITLSSMFGIEHNLLVYGSGPNWSYTELTGFGRSLAPWAWFRLYWLGWAVLLAVACKMLWTRGADAGAKSRWQAAVARLSSPTRGVAIAGVALVLGAGGFVFANTNVINDYLTSAQLDARSADYERLYAPYAGTPQPAITATKLRVELHPDQGTARIHGSYSLRNTGKAAIATLYLSTPMSSEGTKIVLDRESRKRIDDRTLGFVALELAHPLLTGETMTLGFETAIGHRGFTESGIRPDVLPTASYFTSDEVLPTLGYAPGRELESPARRRAAHLSPKPLVPPLSGRSTDRGVVAPPSRFEAIIGTSADQVAVAPGALRKRWRENGRNYFLYTSDTPVGDELAFTSARYAEQEAADNGVKIRVLQEGAAPGDVRRIIENAKSSMDYYAREFGPYRHGALTFVERPGNGLELHAEPTLVTFEEGFLTWRPSVETGGLDLPFAILAHEVAHQWTVPYARMEGAPVMSESIAWYYGMKAVEYVKGKRQLELLRSFMREPNPYPPSKRGVPLVRGLDPYQSYRKGPFALYALSEYIGEKAVNEALRKLLASHRRPVAPLATTLDLYRELEAVTPATDRRLLEDLFKVNTFWDFSISSASAHRTPAGEWRVDLKIHAAKHSEDEAGNKRQLPIDEQVRIGVFGAPRKGGDELSRPLHLAFHRLTSGEQEISILVHDKPSLAGVDPGHLLDWVENENDDNIDRVRIASSHE